jgi:hypothetical protein
MVYRYGQKLKRDGHKIKKYVIGSVATILMAGGMAIPALASNAGDGSAYGTQPGFDQAQTQTKCSGAGAFGAFGKQYNLGNDVSGHYPGASYPGPGADGQQTGANNSTLCGNPQGNP